MSYKTSNLYASRIFSDHPLAFWPLDEEFLYISLLNNSQKNISNWNLENFLIVETENFPVIIKNPNEESTVVTLEDLSESVYGNAYAESIFLEDLDVEKQSLHISANVYAYSNLINQYEIGFIVDGTEVGYSKGFINSANEDWQRIYHSIVIPESFSEIIPFIKVRYEPGGPNSFEDYNVIINAISVGQNSEVYSNINSGSISEEIENDTLSSYFGASVSFVESDNYGISETKNAYYVVENNKNLCQNFGIPMVFGSQSVTRLFSPTNLSIPSIVFPGEGFLNNSGKYKDYTVEFWLRIQPETNLPVKIFGPLFSNDGLYVEEEFLTLKIGKYSKSYFVGKWYRPMLVDICYAETFCYLMINGELVIKIDIDQDYLSMPEIEYDWLGFFSNASIKIFDIDCFAIYPYTTSSEIAKKRFVYAQGVEDPNLIVGSLKGQSYYVDFPFAGYSKYLSYPSMTSWESGFKNNIEGNANYLTFSNYSQPEIIIDNFLIEDFYKDNFLIQDEPYPFIKIRPNENYEDVLGSIYFDSCNPSSTSIKSIFGLFKSPISLTEEKEVIMAFASKSNNNRFKIMISSSGIDYIYNDEILETRPIDENVDFVAGIDIDSIKKQFFSNVGNFFDNLQNISLNLGGYEDSVFSGKIYSLSFVDSFFTKKDLQNYFIDSSGFFGVYPEYSAEYSDITIDEYYRIKFDLEEGDPYPEGEDVTNIEINSLYEYIGNYTMSIILASDSLFIDVGAHGYWEDSIPLSYFGKNIIREDGSESYDLDMLQINIEDASPLDIKNFTDTLEDDFFIKTFVSFQDFKTLGKKSYLDYNLVKLIDGSRVIYYDTNTYDSNEIFKIIDGTVIFIDKNIDNFRNIYMNVHIEAKTRGINSKPFLLKSMDISSLAYDQSSLYEIKTKNGNSIFPISKTEQAANLRTQEYLFGGKNPILISKDSVGYLYLTKDSGIEYLPEPESGPYKYRALSIPINSSRAQDYKISAIQIWMFYDGDFPGPGFSYVKLASVLSNNKDIDIYLDANITLGDREENRAKIIAANPIFNDNTTIGTIDPNIDFFQNGVKVENPYIEKFQWNNILISFKEPISFNSYIGQLEIMPGILFNNVAIYESSEDIISSRNNLNTWEELREEEFFAQGDLFTRPGLWYGIAQNNWNYYIDSNLDIFFNIDGSQINDSFFGVSKAVGSDSSVLNVSTDSVYIYNDISWSDYLIKPL
jgi:hypothetical protein